MKRLLLVTGLAFGLWLSGWAEKVTLTYLRHSCFTLQAGGGPILMIDPYGNAYPLSRPAEACGRGAYHPRPHRPLPLVLRGEGPGIGDPDPSVAVR